MTRQKNSIGLVELSSIAAGFQTADTMLKAAAVELLLNRTICSGKYMVLVGGDVAAVQASVAAGVEMAGVSVIDSCVIANIHPAVFPAVSGNVVAPRAGALGILEAFSVAALIEGADAAVKAADVSLLELRLAMAMGGKAFVRMTGSVASVEAGIRAGAQVVAARGLLVNQVVIPAPAPQILGELI